MIDNRLEQMTPAEVYARFRRKGYEEVQLPGVLGSNEMMAAYWAARNCGTPSVGAGLCAVGAYPRT